MHTRIAMQLIWPNFLPNWWFKSSKSACWFFSCVSITISLVAPVPFIFSTCWANMLFPLATSCKKTKQNNLKHTWTLFYRNVKWVKICYKKTPMTFYIGITDTNFNLRFLHMTWKAKIFWHGKIKYFKVQLKVQHAWPLIRLSSFDSTKIDNLFHYIHTGKHNNSSL